MTDDTFLEDNSDNFTSTLEANETDLLIEYLSNHKMEFLKDFLRERDLPHSYNKADLMERVRIYLSEGEIGFADLVDLLNTIEGWGDQHIYLYENTPQELTETWRNENRVRSILQANNVEELFNTSLPLVLPEESTLSSILWSRERVRFVWVDRRISQQRDADLDYEQRTQTIEKDALQEQVFYKGYRVKLSRGLVVFDWNLIEEQAMLMIQRVPNSKSKTYLETRDKYLVELQDFVDASAFVPLRFTQLIRELEQSDETRKHELKYLSNDLGRITLTSKNYKYDVFEHDGIIADARATMGDKVDGLIGQFYWKENLPDLSRDVYMQVYGENDEDQRISFSAEHSEKDIRYVLSRIRDYCSKTP